jgi:hypothetical protein
LRLQKLDRFLSADGELQPVVAKARDLRHIAGLVGGFLPADLSGLFRVANHREGELVLIAANASAAAKLRLLSPTLSDYLTNQRIQVNSVSVRVQPNSARATSAAPQKSAHLSTRAVDSLSALHARLQPSPAREALGRLLEREKRRKRG